MNESKIFPDSRKSHLWVSDLGEQGSFLNESARAHFGHPIGNLAYFLQLDDWWAENRGSVRGCHSWPAKLESISQNPLRRL